MTDPRAHLAEHGVNRPEFEGDACGVGLVAVTDGAPSRRLVQAGHGHSDVRASSLAELVKGAAMPMEPV